MKKIFLITCIMSSLFFVGCESEEENDMKENDKVETQIALYDKNKESIAYIDYEDRDDNELATIYMYDGTPVGYLYESCIDDGANIYGFNGLFLGWYVKGVVYNRKGYAVGAKHGIMRIEINTNVTHLEQLKSIKKIKPVKHARFVQPVCPLLKDNWSETSLSDFFLLTPKELAALSPEQFLTMYIYGLYDEQPPVIQS